MQCAGRSPLRAAVFPALHNFLMTATPNAGEHRRRGRRERLSPIRAGGNRFCARGREEQRQVRPAHAPLEPCHIGCSLSGFSSLGRSRHVDGLQHHVSKRGCSPHESIWSLFRLNQGRERSPRPSRLLKAGAGLLYLSFVADAGPRQVCLQDGPQGSNANEANLVQVAHRAVRKHTMMEAESALPYQFFCLVSAACRLGEHRHVQHDHMIGAANMTMCRATAAGDTELRAIPVARSTNFFVGSRHLRAAVTPGSTGTPRYVASMLM